MLITAHKPGNFDVQQVLVETCNLFSGFEDRALGKIPRRLRRKIRYIFFFSSKRKEFFMFSYFSQVKAKGKKFLFAALVLVLLTAFLSCKTDSDDFIDDHILNQHLIGTWTDPSAGDGYKIEFDTTSSTYRLSYIDWSATEAYAGEIMYVSNFSNKACVIIIKYDAGKGPSYFTDAHWGTEAAGWADMCMDSQPCSHYVAPTGDFVGIYYENFKPNISVHMGTAIDLSTYQGAEEKTIYDAILTFISGNKGNYIGVMGAYEKQ